MLETFRRFVLNFRNNSGSLPSLLWMSLIILHCQLKYLATYTRSWNTDYFHPTLRMIWQLFLRSETAATETSWRWKGRKTEKSIRFWCHRVVWLSSSLLWWILLSNSRVQGKSRSWAKKCLLRNCIIFSLRFLKSWPMWSSDFEVSQSSSQVKSLLLATMDVGLQGLLMPVFHKL